MDQLSFAVRAPLAVVALVVLFLPMWWAMGRLEHDLRAPMHRALAAGFAAVVGWLTFVNLVGRQLESSYIPAAVWTGINAAATLFLVATRRAELSLMPLVRSYRQWAPVLVIAVAVGFPQWLFAVSTPYWDEVASSAIHITAPVQFTDGVYPPRHNSFPDLPVKYHYASAVLAGTVKLFTGLSANNAVDIVSTSLHLFVFLFLFFWLEQLGLRRLAALWGSFSVLLGGGLAWMYVRSLETYSGFPKVGTPGSLTHSFKENHDYWWNLRNAAETAVFHLKNGDGTNSNLPWDIANQWQQHGVALGIAMAIFAAWLFLAWMKKPESRVLHVATTVTFGLLTLGHAVFGTVTCLTAGLFIVGRWLYTPSKRLLVDGATFVAGVAVLSFAHGGVLSRGDAYGRSLTTIVWRDGFGYSEGGLFGFINWNIAGFGIPMVLAVYALVRFFKARHVSTADRRDAFWFFAIMLAVSYLPAQLLFYSYGGSSVEEHTEIAKFFFVTHLALGVLSGFAVAFYTKRIQWWVAPVAFVAMAIVPLFHIYAAAFDGDGQWTGYYDSPYPRPTYDDAIAMAHALRDNKSGPFDVYFDGEWDEEHRRAFVDELQIHAGSVFSITPRRYERTGSFLIDQTLVGERVRLHGRVARLRPSFELESNVSWIYGRDGDFRRMPAIVRARFAKAVGEGVFKLVHREGPRILYHVDKPTAALDDGIERWFKPRAVVQAHAKELSFYDRKRQALVFTDSTLPLPETHRDDFALVIGGAFGRGPKGDFAVARMADTYFFRGVSISNMVEFSSWFFTAPEATGWSKENKKWGWDHDVPVIADVEGKGSDELVAFRMHTGEWFRGEKLLQKGGNAKGPDVVPAAGKFLPGAALVLAVFNKGSWALVQKGADPAGGAVTVQHGGAEDVIVPGDYDGDKIDELAVYRPKEGAWLVRNPVSGAVATYNFGDETSVPVPYDYDHDGKLDLAVWQAAAHEIRVSFDHGATVGKTIPVPPDALPSFVNMY